MYTQKQVEQINNLTLMIQNHMNIRRRLVEPTMIKVLDKKISRMIRTLYEKAGDSEIVSNKEN